MIVTLIYAIAENKVIGNQNTIPWKLSGDMKYFKTHTTGKPIIMGRKTFESLGKALPNRRNLVISRQQLNLPAGVELFHSLEDALAACQQAEEVCIIGGATLYKEAMAKNLVNQIRQTLVHADVEGDTSFELLDEKEWDIVEVASYPADEKNEYAYTIVRAVNKTQ